MSIDRKLLKKYKDQIDLLRKLDMDDEDIEAKLTEREELEDWEAVTVKELKKMSTYQLTQLMSYCWKDGRPRCDTIGITDLKVEKVEDGYYLSFSDDCGDPHFTCNGLNEKIHKISDDGCWSYGLYKKKTTK